VIRGIVFDFDGVLADSELFHLRSYQEILAAAGIELTKEQYWNRYLGLDDVGVFSQIASDKGLLVADEELELLIREKSRRFEALVTRENVLFPAAVGVVRALAAEWPLGIASGSLRREIDLMLQGAALSDAFKFIVSADDTDRSKPAPDPYLLAVERHGVRASECVAIEDSHQGLQSARAAGLRTVAVASTYPPDSLTSLADVVVDGIEQITVEFITALARG
jgi:beta-phosphoglucomutase